MKTLSNVQQNGTAVWKKSYIFIRLNKYHWITVKLSIDFDSIIATICVIDLGSS